MGKNNNTYELKLYKASIDKLVTAGTITKDQETAIQNALTAAKGTKTTMRTTLDSLVKAGTITQTQEDAILKALPFCNFK